MTPFSPRSAGMAGFAMAALSLGQSSQAAVLAQYEFTNTLSSTDTELLSTAGDFTDGPGIISGYYNNSGAIARSVTVDQTAATEGSANTAGDYFLITITPADGYQLNLSSITMDFAASYSTAGRGVSIRTSVDNFSSVVGGFTEAANTGTSNVFTNQSVSLSAASLQGITGAVTLRVVVYDGASVNTNANRFDNVILNGTVTAVPEPAATGLAAMAGLGFLSVRRRK